MPDERKPTRRDVWIHGLQVLSVFVVIISITVALFWKPFSSKTSSEEIESCQRNLSLLVAASIKYAGDHGGKMPSEGWDRQLAPYLRDEIALSCPRQRRLDPETSGYALNRDVAGKPLSQIDKKTVIFFDSREVAFGLVSGEAESPRPGRHQGGRANNVVYIDGSAVAVPAR